MRMFNRGNALLFLGVSMLLAAGFMLGGCSEDADVTTQEGFGDIAIAVPDDMGKATWHLYGPDNAFYHGDSDQVLTDLPAGKYSVIWNQVDDRTAPAPYTVDLAKNSVLDVRADYKALAPDDSFALVQPGTFIMGSPSGEVPDPVYPEDWVEGDPEPEPVEVPDAELNRDDDEVEHFVDITQAYYLSKVEVTNQEFLELAQWAVDNNHAVLTEDSLLDNLDGSSRVIMYFPSPIVQIDVENGTLRLKDAAYALRPVVDVTWYGAICYCDWLSLSEDMTRAYNHANFRFVSGSHLSEEGYRLPTEAEWEFACRAGTTTPFFNGDPLDPSQDYVLAEDIAWLETNSGGRTHDVGTKTANAWGLQDTHGNVWEWCNDRYGEYEGDWIWDPDPVALADPIGPFFGRHRIMRGGRWALTGNFARAANRLLGAPGYEGENVGIRVAASSVAP